MNKTLNIVKELLIMTFATFIIATSVYIFMIPSGCAISSVSGLAMILNNFIPLPISVITLILNVIVLVIGYFTIGKEFSYKTVYTSILLAVFLFIYERVLPDFKSITNYDFLDVLCHIFFVSIGTSILFSMNASSGGLDIIAKVISKYTHMEIGLAVSLSGMVVAISTVFVYPINKALISIIGSYFSGLIVDHFIFSTHIKRKVCIISKDHLDEIRKYLLYTIHSGVTIYEAIGGLNFEKHYELVAMLDNPEYQKLMDFLEKVDKDAFVSVYNINVERHRKKQVIQFDEKTYKTIDEYISENKK